MSAPVQRMWFMGAGQKDLVFDITKSESHSARLVVTKNPVETGASIADHAYMDPLTLTIEAEVSDTWLHARDESGVLRADPVWGSQLGPDALALFGSTGQTNRSATAWLVLNNLMQSAEPFDVQTGLKLYTDMMLTELSADQDKSSAGKLAFRATLEQVIRVSTKTITYPPRKAGKTAHAASKTVAAGQQPTTQPALNSQKEVISYVLKLAGGPSLDNVKDFDFSKIPTGFGVIGFPSPPAAP